MRAKLICAFITLPLAAAASPTPDAFFTLIQTQDLAAVKTALVEAATEDASVEPQKQRDLFAVFSNSAPAIDAFTTDWLTQSPDDAMALTARGWYFYGMGWAMRGNASGRETSAPAIAKMRAYHRQALEKFQAAIAADPSLIPASDGPLVLAPTLGNSEMVMPELERIMTLAPNRGSLVRAMLVQMPQWGGDMQNIASICDHFAPMVTSIADYTSETCQLDAIYFAEPNSGPFRNQLHDHLIENANPILEYARLADATDRIGTPAWRLKVLEDQMMKADLTAEQALAYDAALNEQTNSGNFYSPETYIAALPAQTIQAKRKVEIDPLNARKVGEYIRAMQSEAAAAEARANGIAFPEVVDADYPFDAKTGGPALETLLSSNPYDGSAWLYLGVAHLGARDLAGIEAAAPYFKNALYYSRYDQRILETVIFTYLTKVTRDRYSKTPLDIAGLSPEELADMDRVIYCPVAKLLVSAAYSCMQNSVPLGHCVLGFPENQEVFDRLMQSDARKECPTFHQGIETSLETAPVAAALDTFAR